MKKIIATVVLTIPLLVAAQSVSAQVKHLLTSQEKQTMCNESACDDALVKNPDKSHLVFTPYKDALRNFSLRLPYNKNWEPKKYQLSVYDKNKTRDRIAFGPFAAGGARGLLREYELAVQPYQNTSKTYSRYKKIMDGMDAGDRKITKLKRLTLAKLPAIMFTFNGDECGSAELTVIGKKNNFTFSSTCGFSEDVTLLQKTAATLKLEK